MSDTYDDEVLAAAEALFAKGYNRLSLEVQNIFAIARRLQGENARLQVEVERALEHERLTYLSEREQLAKRIQAEDAATKAEADATRLATENDNLRAKLREALAPYDGGEPWTTTSADCDHESCERLTAVQALLKGEK